MHQIPGIKNELSDYISRNNFDALIGESSEALAREAFQRMDVQLDLSMRTAGILEGWSLTDYQSEYKEILQNLSTGLEPLLIDGHQWYKNNQYLFYEDQIVVPEIRLDGCLHWSHLSSCHTGANRSVDFFRECFYSSLTLTELRSRMQTIVDACGCHASKQSDSSDAESVFLPTGHQMAVREARQQTGKPRESAAKGTRQYRPLTVQCKYLVCFYAFCYYILSSLYFAAQNVSGWTRPVQEFVQH